MSITMGGVKRIVRDVDAAERFYVAMGMMVVSRNVGGEAEVAQKQSWLSADGQFSPQMLILSQFLELPPPRKPIYPGEAWLTFSVSDVDATCAIVKSAGGEVFRAGQDRPEHAVRAAVVSDPEGYMIELVGPLSRA